MKRPDFLYSRRKGPFLKFDLLILGGLLLFLATGFYGCSDKKASREADKKPKKAVMVPSDGETLHSLRQPLLVFFPEVVPAEHFKFSIAPDPGGWHPVWDPSQKKVRLEHAQPFAPQQEYRIKLFLKDGPALESRFKTPPSDPSALLESDLAQGMISIDQAAQYRVLRLFKPGAVPEKYRYLKAPGSGTWDLLQVANQRDKLKPETIQALEPYLVRPDNPKSIYYRRLFGAGAAKPQAKFFLIATAYAFEPVKELYQTDTGYTVAIYGEPDQAELVHKVRRLVEEHKIYEKFEKLLNRKTVDFGNKTLEIFIFSRLREEQDPVEGPFEPLGYCDPVDWDPLSKTDPGTATTWIALSGHQLQSDPILASTLAHEMFHSFQFAFSRYEYKWLVEGSAVWAQDFIGHDWNTEQKWLPGYTFDPQGAVHNSITERAGFQSYGMYLFFYYLTRVLAAGDEAIMRRIWENCAASRAKTFESVRAALPDELLEIMKEYGLFTLDVETYKGKFPDLVGAYGGQGPLKLLEEHKLLEKWNINENGMIDCDAFFLPAMGVCYLKVQNQAQGPDAPAIRFDLEPFTDKKEIGLQAVIKYRNGRVEKEDWTGLQERIFCLASKTQNFEALYVAVCYATEQGGGDAFSLNILPASDVDCLGGRMRITLTVTGQEESEYRKQWPGDNRISTINSSWERQARFLLRLTPQRSEMTAEVEAALKNIPAEAREQFQAEILKPEADFDENTQCHEYVLRVKDVDLQSLSGTFKRSFKKTHNDAFGLVEQCSEERQETWTSRGLSDETREWVQEKNLEVRVFIDPKSKQIKWVMPQGPIGAQGHIAKDFKKDCTQRKGQPPDTRYEPYTLSKPETQDTVWQVQEVSASVAGLPMSPDWQAKGVNETGVRGEGKSERSLDHSSTDSPGEKTTTKGLEIKKIEWELQLDILPAP